jgi:hypothetical protein
MMGDDTMPCATHCLRGLLAATLFTVLPVPAQADAADHPTWCAGMYHCLQETPRGCSPEDCLPRKNISYDDDYCSVFRELQQRGLQSTTAPGRQIYRQVAGRHRVEYRIEGELPMPSDVLRYLINNLPFATQLVNAYQDTDYTTAYLDKSKRRFTGSGERISGTFTRVLQNAPQTRSLYTGSGTVEVLAWKLRGTTVVVFDFDETSARQCAYSLRCLVFPDSAIVKSILNFSLFRNSITGVLERMSRAVRNAAMAFHRGERAPVAHYPWFTTAEGRRQLEAFDELLQRSMQAPAPVPAPAEQTPQAPSETAPDIAQS